jgi:hypothetical protein
MVDEKLRRYTSLPILLDMLVNKKITLLNPASWEDRNDSYSLVKYQEKKRLKTLLSLCFTKKRETYHHWKVFAGNSGGVCVRFNKDKLLNSFIKDSKIKYGPVIYKTMNEMKDLFIDIEDIPFIKRKQYEDEAEFRIIYADEKIELNSKAYNLDIECIERIILSPWLPTAISKTIKNLIHNIPDCNSIELIRTGVIENTTWKNNVKRKLT